MSEELRISGADFSNFLKITNGIWSHYTSMAVQTDGPGPGWLSILVIPLLSHPGVTMRRISIGGGLSAGTMFIKLSDMKVPVENLGRVVSYFSSRKPMFKH